MRKEDKFLDAVKVVSPQGLVDIGCAPAREVDLTTLKTHVGRKPMHLPERKCNLPLNSLTALSHGKNQGVLLPLLSVVTRTFFFSYGEIILAILENPLQVEKQTLN